MIMFSHLRRRWPFVAVAVGLALYLLLSGFDLPRGFDWDRANLQNAFRVLLTLLAVHATLVAWLTIIHKYAFPLELETALLCLIVLLGLSGMVAFWVYWCDADLGKALSLAFALASLAVLLLDFHRAVRSHLRVANATILPVTTYVFFILLVGFYPFHQIGAAEAANRWLELPIDNAIPRIFADQLRHGNVTAPMFGDWHSSDRPPLQTGLYLLMHHRGELRYQVVSSALQALVLLPCLLLVRRLGYSALAPLATMAIGLTSLMAVHTLYVWPKLISAAYVLIFYHLTMTSTVETLPRRIWIPLAGSSATLAMLSHGGAIFALAVIAGAHALRYRQHFWRDTMPAGMLSIGLYLPWILYQRLVDPPGTRLAKWHLAGMIAPNDLSVAQAIVGAYGALGFGDWVEGRIANLKMVFAGSSRFLYELVALIGDPGLTLQMFRGSIIRGSFFETFYSLWLFSPVVVVILWIAARGWRKAPLGRDVIWLLVTSLSTLLMWCFMMFIPGSAVIHQGSFFPWISLFLLSAIITWQLSASLFLAMTVLNVIVFIITYCSEPRAATLGTDMTFLGLTIMSILAFVAACNYGARQLKPG